MRWALAIDDDTPLITFDARDRLSVRDALLAVLRRTRDRAMERMLNKYRVCDRAARRRETDLQCKLGPRRGEAPGA